MLFRNIKIIYWLMLLSGLGLASTGYAASLDIISSVSENVTIPNSLQLFTVSAGQITLRGAIIRDAFSLQMQDGFQSVAVPTSFKGSSAAVDIPLVGPGYSMPLLLQLEIIPKNSSLAAEGKAPFSLALMTHAAADNKSQQALLPLTIHDAKDFSSIAAVHLDSTEPDDKNATAVNFVFVYF